MSSIHSGEAKEKPSPDPGKEKSAKFTEVMGKRYPRIDKQDRDVKPKRSDVETEHIPEELGNLPRWVCWKWELRESKGKPKWTKPLVDVRTGGYAKCNDPSTWATYSEAMASFRRHADYAGVGFVFCGDDSIMGVDVDGCLKADGSLTQTGFQAVECFGDSYCEISPSGSGLKFIIKASLPEGQTGRKNPKLDVEAYQVGRYFTITGRRWPGSSSTILDKQENFDRWSGMVFPSDKPSVKPADKTDKTPAVAVSASVGEIIDRASSAANGEKFTRLWAGDCSEYGDNRSSGDQALCNILAFWSGNDAGLIDETFRQSGMMREKWEREYYRDRTITKAIESCPDPYNGAGSANTQSQGLQKRERQHEGTVEPPPWPELVPLSGPEPETIDFEDLPRSVGEIIKSVTKYAEVPPELPLLMTLGVLATVSQKKWNIQNDGDYKEPLSLFVCPALDPGNRKTAVVNALTAPLKSWEAEEAIRLKPEIQRAQSKRKTIEARIVHLRTRAAKAQGPHEGEGFQNEISELEENLPPIPKPPELFTSDVTPEKLASLMAEHDEKMAVISDEGGIFEIAGGLYSNGKANLDVFLQGHAGSSVRVHRGSRDPVNLTNPALTIACSVQPSVLFDIGQNATFKGRGLLARFLFAVPKSTLGFRKLETSPIPGAVKDRWHRIVCYLLNSEQSTDCSGVPVSRTIVMTEHAAQLWKSEQRHNEVELREGKAWATERGWASKYPGAVARIAGVLHCADCADNQRDPAEVRLQKATMLHAIGLGRTIKAHTLKAFGMMALNDDQRFALKIADWIRREGHDKFTGRGACRAVNSHGKSSGLKGAFEILSECGWVRQENRKNPRGGPPSETFMVNPKVHSFADNADNTRDDQSEGKVLSAVSAVTEISNSPNIFRVEDEDPDFIFPSDGR